ncbi:alpha/beta fold hydrolase [Streptomyces sp. NPDC016309]|uniref:alpha/beta fold hydrolase n=1 Tax=Streptomyces sp. NPDC016309 TaxID=3364965 RepID=UPI0036FC037B
MTLSYDHVAGDGPAVVLLHAGVCDRRMWDPQWPALSAAGYRLVRCDLRGFGATPAPDRPHNDAEDVRDLLDALGIERAVLVASSFGGRVALEVAARWPERVGSMVLLSPAVDGHEPSAALRAFGAREDELLEAGDVAAAVELNVDTWVGPEADETTRDAVHRMQRHAFDVQLAVTEEFGRIRHEADLSAVTAPTVVLSGAHDVADFRLMAAELPGRLKDARHVELPWAGHLPSMERPAEVTDLLLGLLREAAPAGA